MKTNVDQCIKCSICNAYCPVLRATGLFPGPKLAGPDAERFRLKGKIIPAEWLEFCDYCKICERVCPHNVPIPELHIRSRLASAKARKHSFRDWLLGRSYLLEKFGSWGAPLSNWIHGKAFFRWLLDRGLGIDRRAHMPAFNRQTFTKWFRARNRVEGKPLAYFYGCFTNYIEPALGRCIVEILEKNGFRVFLPKQECCGLPFIGNGFLTLAARMGKKNLKTLQKTVEDGVEIVFSSPSCGMTLTQEYEKILNLPGALSLAQHVFEISQFLLRLYEGGKLKTDFREIRETYHYHAPCHLRALQIGLPALELLSLIPGLKVIELPEGCCGLAGTYGLKREKYAVSREIGEDIFRVIRQGKVQKVISDCEACRMQIQSQTGVSTFHPAQIIRQAYGD